MRKTSFKKIACEQNIYQNKKKLLLKKVYKLFILWCNRTKINLITMRYFTDSLTTLNIFAELSKVSIKYLGDYKFTYKV